jgi:LAO/AO transport system kinase
VPGEVSPAPSNSKDSQRGRPATVEGYVTGVLAGDRAVMGRAITLVESRNPDHQALAQDMLQQFLPRTGKAQRLGITGVPGVGKSTFIEAFGSMLTAKGHKVAVLAVDPTSTRSGGSILGDKTRMQELSRDENAFIRPSPSSGTLGGVTRTTRETMAVCEAAGFDVIIVETVGVGQSETAVANMVDLFLVLMLPGAGDELQGIKKGVLEIADMLAVNKSDGDMVERARRAASEYRQALHILTPTSPNWSPPVLTCSAVTKDGIEEIWQTINEHRETLTASGELAEKRQAQQTDWMWSMIRDRLITSLEQNAAVRSALPEIEVQVRSGALTATTGAERLLAAFGIAQSETPG